MFVVVWSAKDRRAHSASKVDQINMGIQGLTKLLSDEAPNCMKEVDLDSLTGRKVAVDASMAMYQFLVREYSRV